MVEFAFGMGATARLCARLTRATGATPCRCVEAPANATGLASRAFSVVYGEALLS